MTFRDLAEYGLPLFAPGTPEFQSGFEAIRQLPLPFGPPSDLLPENAALLENRTNSAVITMAHVWKYSFSDGEVRSSLHLNLGSGTRMDVLTGRRKAVRDLTSFILPGSRRLIAEQGIFGDNRDVLPSPPGIGGAWAGGGMGGRAAAMRSAGGGEAGSEQSVVMIELQLDVAIFEDGLCAGPDNAGLREGLNKYLQARRNTAEEILDELRQGAPAGRIFEILRPLVNGRGRPSWPSPGNFPSSGTHRFLPLLSMFAREAIELLTSAGDAELLSWMESAAHDLPLRLHRPGE